MSYKAAPVTILLY